MLAKKGIMKHISTGGTGFWKKFKWTFRTVQPSEILYCFLTEQVQYSLKFYLISIGYVSTFSQYLMSLSFLLFMLNQWCWILLCTSEKTSPLIYKYLCREHQPRKCASFSQLTFLRVSKASNSLQVERRCPELLKIIVIVSEIIITFYFCS